MSKGIKIFLGVLILLSILSGAFLLFAKKRPAASPTTQVKKSAPVVKNSTVTTPIVNNASKNKPAPTKVATPIVNTQDKTKLAATQWAQCKAKTLTLTTELMWNVQITEGIPTKGTYAKGNLNGDKALPVHVIVKADSKIADKVKLMLVVGKNAILRGNCTEIATDGAVVVQAF